MYVRFRIVASLVIINVHYFKRPRAGLVYLRHDTSVCWQIKIRLESGPVTADLTTTVVHSYTADLTTTVVHSYKLLIKRR